MWTIGKFFLKYPFHCIVDHWQRVKKIVTVFCTSSKCKGCQSGDLTLGNSHEWQRENFSIHYQFNIKQKIKWWKLRKISIKRIASWSNTKFSKLTVQELYGRQQGISFLLTISPMKQTWKSWECSRWSLTKAALDC